MNLANIESRETDGMTHVVLTGELDISVAPGLEAELQRLEQRAPAVLVLDLSGLDFMDSTGLRLVLGADSRARRDGRRLVVVRGPHAVHRVFRIALLDQRLEFIDDVSALDVDRGG